MSTTWMFAHCSISGALCIPKQTWLIRLTVSVSRNCSFTIVTMLITKISNRSKFYHWKNAHQILLSFKWIFCSFLQLTYFRNFYKHPLFSLNVQALFVNPYEGAEVLGNCWCKVSRMFSGPCGGNAENESELLSPAFSKIQLTFFNKRWRQNCFYTQFIYKNVTIIMITYHKRENSIDMTP